MKGMETEKHSRELVEEAFQRVHPKDLTNKELADAMGVEQMGDISPRVSELRDRGILRRTENKRRGQSCHVWVPPQERMTVTPNHERRPKIKPKSSRNERDELLGVRPGVPASKIIAAIVRRIRQQPTFLQFGSAQTPEASLASLNAFFELFSVRSHIPLDVYRRQRAKIFCAVEGLPAEKKYAETLDSLYGDCYRTCFAELVAKGKTSEAH